MLKKIFGKWLLHLLFFGLIAVVLPLTGTGDAVTEPHQTANSVFLVEYIAVYFCIGLVLGLSGSTFRDMFGALCVIFFLLLGASFTLGSKVFSIYLILSVQPATYTMQGVGNFMVEASWIAVLPAFLGFLALHYIGMSLGQVIRERSIKPTIKGIAIGVPLLLVLVISISTALLHSSVANLYN
ncbi:MAG: hypothetical protein ACM3PP_05480 [Candidatus Saccharibacteria bacterium]